MIKRSVQELEGISATGDDSKGVTLKILVGRDDNAPNFAMRHISVEPEGFTPKHKHDWEHEIIVLGGSGELECDGEVTPIEKGDSIFIPSNQLHQFRSVGDVPLEFICVVPVESECGADVPCS